MEIKKIRSYISDIEDAINDEESPRYIVFDNQEDAEQYDEILISILDQLGYSAEVAVDNDDFYRLYF